MGFSSASLAPAPQCQKFPQCDDHRCPRHCPVSWCTESPGASLLRGDGQPPLPLSCLPYHTHNVSIWIKHIRVGGRGRGLMLGSGLRRKQGQKDTMTQRKCREGEAGCALPTGSTGSSLGSWVLPSPSRKTQKCRSTPDKETRTVPRCRISWKGSLVRSASPPSWCPSHTHTVLSVKPRGGTPLGQQTLINAPPNTPLQF